MSLLPCNSGGERWARLRGFPAELRDMAGRVAKRHCYRDDVIEDLILAGHPEDTIDRILDAASQANVDPIEVARLIRYPHVGQSGSG